jgi:hypothetical protein
MYSFKDFIIANPGQEEDELLAYIRQKRKRNDDIGTTVEQFEEMVDTDEALTTAQRMKMKATFRKNKAKIALGKKKAAKKLASPEKLKARAEKQAREILIKKILKDKSKSDLGFAGRTDLVKKLSKKKGAIKKIAKKLLPQVKAADREKLKGKGGAE